MPFVSGRCVTHLRAPQKQGIGEPSVIRKLLESEQSNAESNMEDAKVLARDTAAVAYGGQSQSCISKLRLTSTHGTSWCRHSKWFHTTYRLPYTDARRLDYRRYTGILHGHGVLP